MFDLGFLELLVIAVIGLLVLGPERLPKVIKQGSLLLSKSRHFANSLTEEFEREANLGEIRDSINQKKTDLSAQLDQVKSSLSIDGVHSQEEDLSSFYIKEEDSSECASDEGLDDANNISENAHLSVHAQEAITSPDTSLTTERITDKESNNKNSNKSDKNDG